VATEKEQSRLGVDLEDPPVKAVGQGRFWNVVIVAVLIVGVTLSIVCAFAWKGYVQGQAENAFAENASNVSAAVSSSLRENLDFVATERSEVVAIPNLSNRALSRWYQSLDIIKRFPAAKGFSYVQRVPAADLRQFGAEVIADPPINEPVVSPYAVFPSGQRAQYCLQRFGIAISPVAKVIPTGFDFCSPSIPPGNSLSPIPRLLQESTDSGESTVLNSVKMAKMDDLAGLFVVFSPVYASTTTPASETARKQESRGWIVSVFSGPDFLRSEVVTDHALTVTALFDDPAPGAPEVISSVGRTPSGPLFTHTVAFNADGAWMVRVAGSARSSATTQAVGVGLLGVAISVLLFVLFVLLTRSRTMALRLVQNRTRQLRHQALYDSLTGLPSRALLFDRAEKMLARALRLPLSVGALYIDLDNFKEINDTFGHPVGDQLLVAVGARLSEEMRANDSVSRLGGDEFVVLAEGGGGAEGPEAIASRLVEALSRPFTIENTGVGPLRVSASIGVAVGYREGVDELLHDADVALYEAKARGKHGFVVFDPHMRRDFTEEPAPDQELTPASAEARVGQDGGEINR
jgi:diguanylate cyclase (GGDEF)-like protein